MPEKKAQNIIHPILPILFLIGMILYGLVLRPYIFNQSSIPLEIIFISASFFSASHLWYLGYTWDTLIDNAVKKLTKGLPTILILFAIGMVIGSWIVSGTIPMFVYYGIKLINPSYIYVLGMR